MKYEEELQMKLELSSEISEMLLTSKRTQHNLNEDKELLEKEISFKNKNISELKETIRQIKEEASVLKD